VVNHLQKVFKSDDSVAITYMYLNYKEQKEQSVPNLMASLLKQMVQDRHETSNSVKTLYSYHQDRSTRPTLDELTEALKTEIEAYSKVFILVDALDECEHPTTRARLLRTLQALTMAGTVQLMVTSRDLPTIAREFRHTKRLDIIANDQDVRRYLEGQIAAGPRHLQPLREDIVKNITQNAAGM
jgi:uncharacterized protein YPO0396